MLPILERAGYAVFAISYDRPADLKGFADAHHVDYSLLADEGSRVIRALGVLDHDLAAHHAAFGGSTRPEQLGVAYPMTFVLDWTGRVERKIVEANYRLRNGGHWLVEELLGKAADERGPRVEATATGPLAIVSGRAWLDSRSYFPYQRLGLHLELSVAPGWHVYGPAMPVGYTALGIDIESGPEGVQMGPVAWPEPTPFRIPGLDEEFSVYEGAVAITMPLDFTIPRNSGVVRLEIAVHFQTCSVSECLPPNEISLTLAVPEAPVP